jgi:hypothetical protein
MSGENSNSIHYAETRGLCQLLLAKFFAMDTAAGSPSHIAQFGADTGTKLTGFFRRFPDD